VSFEKRVSKSYDQVVGALSELGGEMKEMRVELGGEMKEMRVELVGELKGIREILERKGRSRFF